MSNNNDNTIKINKKLFTREILGVRGYIPIALVNAIHEHGPISMKRLLVILRVHENTIRRVIKMLNKNGVEIVDVRTGSNKPGLFVMLEDIQLLEDTQ